MAHIFLIRIDFPLECSSIVYQYRCESCSHLYIGSSMRNLYMPISEHQGKSYRTGNYVHTTNSSIFDHKLSCDTQIEANNFKILDHSSSEFRLRILESLYIHKERPQLNDMQSAMPLLVIQHWFNIMFNSATQIYFVYASYCKFDGRYARYIQLI